jgi:hypothetical protein
MAMRSAVMLGTSSSSFSGRSIAARSSSGAVSAAPRAVVVSVEAAGRDAHATRKCKQCDLTGKHAVCENHMHAVWNTRTACSPPAYSGEEGGPGAGSDRSCITCLAEFKVL